MTKTGMLQSALKERAPRSDRPTLTAKSSCLKRLLPRSQSMALMASILVRKTSLERTTKLSIRQFCRRANERIQAPTSRYRCDCRRACSLRREERRVMKRSRWELPLMKERSRRRSKTTRSSCLSPSFGSSIVDLLLGDSLDLEETQRKAVTEIHYCHKSSKEVKDR